MNLLYTIYTDGGFRRHHHRCAYAYLIIKDNQVIAKQAKAFTDTENLTNNQMELSGVISSLEYLINHQITNVPVTINSDSRYIMSAFNQHWIQHWLNNNWENSEGQPVKNKEMWLHLLNNLTYFPLHSFVKVKAHKDNKLNNAVDAMVNYAMDNLPRFK